MKLSSFFNCAMLCLSSLPFTELLLISSRSGSAYSGCAARSYMACMSVTVDVWIDEKEIIS